MLYLVKPQRNKNRFGVVTVLVVALAALMLYQVGMSFTSVHAQAHASSMRSLIEELTTRVKAEAGFTFTLTFVTPLGTDMKSIYVGDPSDKAKRYVYQIGDDYICFKENVGATDGVRCTPLSNILTATYLVN